MQLRLIEILRAGCDSFLQEKIIYIGAQPVGVGRFSIRAGSDEQLIRTILRGPILLFGLMLEEGGTALETTGQLRIGPLPITPARQRLESRQIVAIGHLLDDQIQ